MRDLKCIFVTHIHGDHQLGTIRLMQERDKLVDPDSHPEDKLYIVCPSPLTAYL
jgi:ribonuclease BN (tRNA processing enzyme)